MLNNMDEEYIVVRHDQEVYTKTFRHEFEIVDSLDEGFVSAVLRLKDGKLEYANIEWPIDIDNDAKIIWKELLMKELE